MSRLIRFPSKVGDDKAGTQQRVLRSTLLTVLLFLQTATSSQAFTINIVGTSGGNPGGLPVYEVTGLVQGDIFTVNWNHVTQGETLSATATLTVVSLSPAVAHVSINVANTSTIGRLTIFGLGVEHFLTLGTGVPGIDLDTFDDIPSNVRDGFPGLKDFVNACATSGNNCAGGGGGGIVVAGSDAFTFALNGTFASTLTLEGLALKIQDGPSGNSFELSGTPGPVVPVELQEFSVE